MSKLLKNYSGYVILAVALLVATLMMPVYADAQTPPGNGNPTGTPPATSTAVGTGPADTTNINFAWDSQVDADITAGGVAGLIETLLRALTVVMIPIITLMIIYSGFLYVTARGNAEQVRKATTSLTYAIIGAILIIGAIVLTEILEQSVTDIRNG